ncbi:MAG: isocitrate/isopropylmalate dehydrogenase family protein [Proteobacteria bacterium]|nr:isocitrate/isopropylmalate dehydrogenase family protein [Pseudomonadota bacterium]
MKPLIKKIRIAVLPGDGIGAEVCLAALPLFKVLDIPVELILGDIGWRFWQEEGTPIPTRTWELIKDADATLVGAITSKPEYEAKKELRTDLQNKGLAYISPLIQMRQKLDLFANIRPCFNIQNKEKAFNCCIIRENTEGLYAGFDYYPLPQAIKGLFKEDSPYQKIPNDELSCSLRLQSKQGLLRLFNFAFAFARKEGLNQVTFADKPNVLRQSSAFARVLFESVAANYSDIGANILNVDAVALWLVRSPEKFGVITAENMFGDILSDVAAGVMGGLGCAPSANIGTKNCYFEPVHGSAPGMEPNKASPVAMFLTVALLLKQFAFYKEALIVENAVRAIINEGRILTYDLGGKASLIEMATAIIEACEKG